MALLAVAGGQVLDSLADLVEAHRGVRSDGEVVPAMDELASAQTAQAFADITGDAERAGKLVFSPRSLALGVQHEVEYGAVEERVLLQPLWDTVCVHGELQLLVPRRRGSSRCRRRHQFSVVD